MQDDKVRKFVTRWKELQQHQSHLDHAKAVLARDIRGEFRSGEVGDQQFVGWCSLELGMSARQAKDLLARASLLKLAPDVERWERLGGFPALRPVAELPERQRKAVVSEALSAGRTVRAILYGRGAPVKRPAGARADAEELAKYVASLRSVPDRIREIAARYVEPVALKRAA